VGSLTPADVKRWDLNAIHTVFETASGRANTLQRLGDSLQQAHNVLADWKGEAGDAFRTDVGKIRRDIEADGAESKQVAAAVSRAEADVRACKRELDDIEQAAHALGWTITPDWRIDVGDKGIGANRLDLALRQQMLQDELNACKVHAHTADHELATALGAAVGAVPLDAAGASPGGGGPAPQGPPNPAPGGKPQSLQDMLLPAGPADTQPGGAPPKVPPVPTGAGGQRSLEEMLLPAGPADAGPRAVLPKGPPVPAGAGGQPRTWKEMLVPAGAAPPPRLPPADVESFKALARPVMINDGVPPDQIETRLNDIVGRTQQWIDQGMPNYIPPEPKAPPPPGFGEGFGDRWFATEQGIKDLIGQGGPGAPGVLKSWEQMLRGTLEATQNPMGTAIGEVKNALDSPSPAYYLGGKASDAAVALPGLLFGGEGAAAFRAGELAEVGPGVLDTGPVVSPHAPVGFDHPFGYNPWADGAATDLNSAFTHGGPTPSISRQLADMSTHYVGDDPDRVVLGKFDGHESGYIGEARGQGGIYFDTGDPAWDAMTHGLSRAAGNGLAWQVNEQFLRGQMETGVSRIEYSLPQGFNSVEEVLALRPDSFSAKEIAFLKSNAEAYGYQQVGASWVRVTGGRR
jgi:uncharacterized protein YukE